MSETFVLFPFVLELFGMVNYLKNLHNGQVFDVKCFRPHLVLKGPFLVDKSLYFSCSLLLSDLGVGGLLNRLLLS